MSIFIFYTKYPEKLYTVMEWNTAIITYKESWGSYVPYQGVILSNFLF